MNTPDLPFHLKQVARVLLAVLVCGPCFADARLGPGLPEKLNTMRLLEEVVVLVTFDQTTPLTNDQILAVRSLGVVKGTWFRHLPMVAVAATATQITDLSRMDGVRSIYLNKRLTYTNDTARKLTGVDAVRADNRLFAAGIPLSGRGVTVMINDSGIDASHPDLTFGTRVVANVLGLTNPQFYTNLLGNDLLAKQSFFDATLRDQLLPARVRDGVLITDLGSGHGTHCAGTVGGSGAASNGRYAGVAPGADLVGYGSGAVLFVLDTLGAYDYAMTHQYAYDHPLRIMSNSWGTTGPFDPEDPVVIAGYLAYRQGILSVFAAGNEGPEEGSHNPYARAPWVLSVAAGDAQGMPADFSSRGRAGSETTFTMPDGAVWTAVDAPGITAPGVGIVSARAATSTLGTLSLPEDTAGLDPAHIPFYAHMQGTSMACPHVAGVAALMWEANPDLTPLEVIDLLRRTAVNIPGREAWEVGAGYLDAYAAVVAAAGLRAPADTVNNLRAFRARAQTYEQASLPFTLYYDPLLANDQVAFQVDADVTWVKASADVYENALALVLTNPAGETFRSLLSLPLLGSRAAVSAPGMPGTWTVHAEGASSLLGVPLDPLGLTAGVGLPDIIDGQVRLIASAGFTGMDDVAGHPAAGAIGQAVSERLMDACEDGFEPDRDITRGETATYLVMGHGIRQNADPDGDRLTDTSAAVQPFAEAVTRVGAAMRDAARTQQPIMPVAGTSFSPDQPLTRMDLAYALVQVLGMEEAAGAFTGLPAVTQSDGVTRTLIDAEAVPVPMRGYVQLMLDLGIMAVYHDLTDGGAPQYPTPLPAFRPAQSVSRAEFALIAARCFDAYAAD